MTQYLITLIYCLSLFEIDDIQEFDTRWDEVLLSMSKIPSDDILENLYKLRIRESDQLKNRTGIEKHGDSSEGIGSQLSEVENHSGGENIRNFDCGPLTLGMGEVNQEQWSRIERD